MTRPTMDRLNRPPLRNAAALIRGYLLSIGMAKGRFYRRWYQLSRHNHGALVGYQQAGLVREGKMHLPTTIHEKLPQRGGPLRGVSDRCSLFKWALPQVGGLGRSAPTAALLGPEQWQELLTS